MMAEIKGELSVTLKVKDSGDMQRILEFAQSFEAAPVVKQPKRERVSAESRRISKRESQDKILALLKETFRESFTMRNATAKVYEKLELRSTSTKHAISRAKREGTLLRRGKTYVWTEVVQKQVEAKLQKQPQAPATDQPIAPAPTVE